MALLGAQVGLVADDCEGDGVGALGKREIVSGWDWGLLGRGRVGACVVAVGHLYTAARRARAQRTACLQKNAPAQKKTYQVIQDLIPNNAHHLEALLAADRIHNHVAMNANKVLGVEDAVLVLAGGVDHLDGKVMVAVADDLAESVFDGRVVRVDEVPVDVLHCEGGFACCEGLCC